MKHLRLILLSVLLLSLTTLQAQQQRALTSPPYRVGDYYNDGTLEGVVFAVEKGGTEGKIVGLTQSPVVKTWATTNAARKKLIGATDLENGYNNLPTAKYTTDRWSQTYPAFAWCDNLGTGWYLPAVGELRQLLLNPAVHRSVNTTLQQLGATPLPERTAYTDFWTSTERDFRYQSGEYCVWGVNMRNGATRDNGKSRFAYVRAVATFPLGSYTVAGELSTPTSAPYSVGDYFYEGDLRGVVIATRNNGQSGTIVSLIQSTDPLVWATDSHLSTAIGSTSTSDGKANTALLLERTSTMADSFPVATWCKELGESWYIPAIEELELLFFTPEMHALINATLTRLGAPPLLPAGDWGKYWSSTESEFGATGYFLYNSESYSVDKSTEMYVRAFADF